MPKRDAQADIRRLCYDIEETAAALGIDRVRTANLIRLGVLPHIPFGRRSLVGIRALEQWVTENCLANVTRRLDSLPPARPTPLRKRARRAASS